MIDVVQKFEDYATAAGYEFAYGREGVKNWQLSEGVTLSAGKIVLLVDPFIETAQIDNSIIFKWSVATTIALGKKFDVTVASGTYSQLDETDLQKYDRRLQAMRSNMETLLKTIFCNDDDLELTSARVLMEMNRFDENIEIVAAEITFLYES